MNDMTNNKCERATLASALRLNNLEALVEHLSKSAGGKALQDLENAAFAAVDRAGRGSYAMWGLWALMCAAGLVGAGIFLPAVALYALVLGALAFATGIVCMFVPNPKAITATVHAYARAAMKQNDDVREAARKAAHAHCAAANQQAQEYGQIRLRAGDAGGAITADLAEVKSAVRSLKDVVATHLLDEEAAAKVEEEAAASALSALVLASTGVRASAHRARRAAGEAVTSLMRHAACLRTIAILEVVRDDLIPVLEEIASRAASVWAANVVESLAAMQRTASDREQRLAADGLRDIYGKTLPNPADVQGAAREVVEGRNKGLLEVVAANVATKRVAVAVSAKIAADLAAAQCVPESIGDCINRLNGGFKTFVKQLCAESEEMVPAKPALGRARRRFRTVMMQNHGNSALFGAIKELTQGSECRGLEHARADEVIVINEERFQPGAEFPELVEAAEALKRMPRERLAGMITACDDADFVLKQCNPEINTDPLRGVHLLCLGLAMRGVERSAKAYRLDAVVLAGHGDRDMERKLGDGFDAAVEALQTDVRLATCLEDWLRAEITKKGVEAAKQEIADALAKTGFVPERHAERVRSVLQDDALLLEFQG